MNNSVKELEREKSALKEKLDYISMQLDQARRSTILNNINNIKLFGGTKEVPFVIATYSYDEAKKYMDYVFMPFANGSRLTKELSTDFDPRAPLYVASDLNEDVSTVNYLYKDNGDKWKEWLKNKVKNNNEAIIAS